MFGVDVIYLAFVTQIMITKNIDIKCGIVNGSRGVVVDFDKGSFGLFRYIFI